MLVLAVMSVLSAPACLAAMPALFRQKRLDLMAGAGLLFILALAFNLTNAVGLAASDRDHRSEDRSARMSKISRAEERLSRLNTDLTDYRKISRDETVAMVDAELLRMKADPIFARSKGCADVTLPDSKAHCGKIADALGRKGAAEKVDALTTEIRDVTERLNSWGPAPVTADPKVDRLTRFLAVITPISASSTGLGLDFMVALLVEVLGALLPAIAFAAFWPRGEIEAGAKRRLADEYDAAQDRGEVPGPAEGSLGRSNGERPATAADIGLSRKEIHEARQLRSKGQKKGQPIPPCVRAFAGKCIVRRSGASIQASPLYAAYSDDCRAAGIEPVSQKQFGLAMAALGYRKRQGRVVVYEGIALRLIRPSLTVVNGVGIIDSAPR